MRSIDRAIRIATLSAGKFTKSQVDILRETIKALYTEGGEEAFFSISPIPIEGKENADVWVEGEDLQNGIGLALEETGQTHYSLSVVVSEPAPEYTPPTVSGGVEYDVLRPDGRMWRVHEFKTSGELSVTDLGDDPTARVVLVGGGGSGGYHSITQRWASSGAGGSVVDESVELALGEWPVTVGAGGARVSSNGPGLAGSQTLALGITALGGAPGAAHDSPGADNPGGSASGGAAWTASDTRPLPGGTGARDGGDGGWAAGTSRAAGGSAGAGSAGGHASPVDEDDKSPARGGDAGWGVQSDISGEMRWYGPGSPGSTGSGGDAAGSPAPGGVSGSVGPSDGEDATSPGGGGGAGNSAAHSGAGGDGIAYISYPLEALP